MLNWQPIETFPRDVGEFSPRFVVVYTSSRSIAPAWGATDASGEFCIYEMHSGFGLYKLSKPSLEVYLRSEHAQHQPDAEIYWKHWEVATHWCEVTPPED